MVLKVATSESLWHIQIRESSFLWVDLENFSKVTVEGNILDGVKGVSEILEAGLDL